MAGRSGFDYRAPEQLGPVKSVQRGVTTVGRGDSTVDVTIGEVVPEKCSVRLHSYARTALMAAFNYTTGTFYPAGPISLTKNTLKISAGSCYHTTTDTFYPVDVAWEVVEFY